MEKDNSADSSRWVGECLAALKLDREFHPDAVRALARFRWLRDARSRHGQIWGWTVAVASATFLCLLALPAPRAATQRFLSFYYASLQQSAPAPDRPEYVGTRLVRPVDYREWVYLSSGLGMEYSAAIGGPENFTNVFVPRWAYREFLGTGKWPDKAMFVLESRDSQTKGSINKTGHYQTGLTGLGVEVKDETRFARKWAYFSFEGDTKIAETMTGPSDACWRCHDENGAVEHTFVQFYPTLKPVALKFGTYRAQAD